MHVYIFRNHNKMLKLRENFVKILVFDFPPKNFSKLKIIFKYMNSAIIGFLVFLLKTFLNIKNNNNNAKVEIWHQYGYFGFKSRNLVKIVLKFKVFPTLKDQDHFYPSLWM